MNEEVEAVTVHAEDVTVSNGGGRWAFQHATPRHRGLDIAYEAVQGSSDLLPPYFDRRQSFLQFSC